MKKWEKNEKRTKVLLDLRNKYFYWSGLVLLLLIF